MLRQSEAQGKGSDKNVDVHILVVPDTEWRSDVRNTHLSICSKSISAGFVRVDSGITLCKLRTEISQQLDNSLLPDNYTILRNIGHRLTWVGLKQEAALKVRLFLPPLAPSPEIYVLDSSCLQSQLPPVKTAQRRKRSATEGYYVRNGYCNGHCSSIPAAPYHHVAQYSHPLSWGSCAQHYPTTSHIQPMAYYSHPFASHSHTNLDSTDTPDSCYEDNTPSEACKNSDTEAFNVKQHQGTTKRYQGTSSKQQGSQMQPSGSSPTGVPINTTYAGSYSKVFGVSHLNQSSSDGCGESSNVAPNRKTKGRRQRSKTNPASSSLQDHTQSNAACRPSIAIQSGSSTSSPQIPHSGLRLPNTGHYSQANQTGCISSSMAQHPLPSQSGKIASNGGSYQKEPLQRSHKVDYSLDNESVLTTRCNSTEVSTALPSSHSLRNMADSTHLAAMTGDNRYGVNFKQTLPSHGGTYSQLSTSGNKHSDTNRSSGDEGDCSDFNSESSANGRNSPKGNVPTTAQTKGDINPHYQQSNSNGMQAASQMATGVSSVPVPPQLPSERVGGAGANKHNAASVNQGTSTKPVPTKHLQGSNVNSEKQTGVSKPVAGKQMGVSGTNKTLGPSQKGAKERPKFVKQARVASASEPGTVVNKRRLNKQKRQKSTYPPTLQLRQPQIQASRSNGDAQKQSRRIFSRETRQKASNLDMEELPSVPPLPPITVTEAQQTGDGELTAKTGGKVAGVHSRSDALSSTTESDKSRPSTAETNHLLGEIRRMKEECEELSGLKAKLSSALRSIQLVARTEREKNNNEWKRKYFQEKKVSTILEDQVQRKKMECQKIENELDKLQARKYRGAIQKSSYNPKVERPSESSNIRIQCRRQKHDIEHLKSRLDTVKLRLSAEKKARKSAVSECKALRSELIQKKISRSRRSRKTEQVEVTT